MRPPPPEPGITHWSSRLLARQVGVDHATVARVWRDYGLQPVSTDPELEAKLRDIVGGSTSTRRPCRGAVRRREIPDPGAGPHPADAARAPRAPASPTHHYVRHGTTTLFAALEAATGKVTDACYQPHRHQEFLAFLKQVARAYPRVKLYVVCDNYGTHKHPAVANWLARHQRITLHFTPTSGSWLNLVEAFFAILTRQAIHRGSFPSVADLKAAIRRFIDSWNQRCEPFVWTKDADSILAKLAVGPKNTKDAPATVH